jgi:hypothetical protein
MDRGDGGVFLDEYRVLELTPVPGLWRVLGGRWARVGLYNDWLEVGHVNFQDHMSDRYRLPKISISLSSATCFSHPL